jgi:hypothetical protein
MRALLVLVACSFVLSGCDSSSTTAPARVVIGASSSPSDFRLIVNAPNTAVTLNSVTLHLLTGNNVGGPSITFPQAGLTSTFGSTFVSRGGSRTFVFPPPFGCSSMHPCKIQADATFVDASGMQQFSSTTATIP